MTIELTNNDPLQSLTVDFALWQSSRLVTRHDWRTIRFFSTNPAGSRPTVNLESSIVAYVPAATLNPSTTQGWICPTYAGQASLTLVATAYGGISVQIFAALAPLTLLSWPSLWQSTPAAGINSQPLALPRCPVYIEIGNSGADPEGVGWTLIATEFAS